MLPRRTISRERILEQIPPVGRTKGGRRREPKEARGREGARGGPIRSGIQDSDPDPRMASHITKTPTNGGVSHSLSRATKDSSNSRRREKVVASRAGPDSTMVGIPARVGTNIGVRGRPPRARMETTLLSGVARLRPRWETRPQVQRTSPGPPPLLRPQAPRPREDPPRRKTSDQRPRRGREGNSGRAAGEGARRTPRVTSWATQNPRTVGVNQPNRGPPQMPPSQGPEPLRGRQKCLLVWTRG